MTAQGADNPLVLVVDDDPSMRAAIEDLLASTGLAVRSFKSAQEFSPSAIPDAPACLVLDIKMPGESGLDLQRRLLNSDVPLPVVFITGHGDIPMSVQAMKAGAIEFLTKPFLDHDLLQAIARSLDLNRAQRKDAAALAELRSRFDSLSKREREIIAIVVSGRPNKRIAADLNLSEITVKVHRGQVMRKMKAANLIDLARMFYKLSNRKA